MLPDYCAVIRTLGTAGEKYQELLNSLISQTHPPKRIIVYLAEGYEKPKETVGFEEIIYVKKGMVAQRALPYIEIDTDWILFLDDDIFIEKDGVEKIFKAVIDNQADCCAIDAFPHEKLPWKTKVIMMLLLISIPRFYNKNKGYSVNFLGTECYNYYPSNEIAWSTTNSGNAFICRKKDFLKLHFDQDLWLDESPYAIPEDKVMFFKMHLFGFKILTHYKSGFKHLDAGTALSTMNDRVRYCKIIKSSTRNNYIFDSLYVKPMVKRYHFPIRFILKGYSIVAKYIYFSLKSFPKFDYINEYLDGLQEGKKCVKKLKTERADS